MCPSLPLFFSGRIAEAKVWPDGKHMTNVPKIDTEKDHGTLRPPVWSLVHALIADEIWVTLARGNRG